MQVVIQNCYDEVVKKVVSVSEQLLNGVINAMQSRNIFSIETS